MRLLFKQRFFSWLDSYDIYDEQGNILYTVEGKLSFGHCLHILDKEGIHIGTVKEEVFTFLPRFAMYINENYIGCIKKEFTFFVPKFTLDCNGWQVEGQLMEWDYTIVDRAGTVIATIGKELFHWTDTYVLDVAKPEDALGVLMIALAIDAEKCSRS